MPLPELSQFIPHLAYDSVVFGFSRGKLKILLMEYHATGWHALPGGFIGKTENLEDAVKRGLFERTGLKEIYLEQFHTFGEVNRFKPEVMKRILEANDYSVPPEYWMLDRFFSVAYYALIDHEKVTLQPDAISDSIAWYEIEQLPELIFDHGQIVQKALQTLRENLDRKLIGGNLLPDHFTMNELQAVYEAILGEKLRRTSFQRKMLSMDILDRHEKLFTGKSHKAPYLYSFKTR
ncbi:ADP-ribose pyrophosphatase YjhB, NUDIX family [Algoriphagus alkaliphilus]|uniref:ADP-ribose pyrophosphatase YjhB, NUDIX family n=1 Tax=Algoriphagus alkaliphilus TaxID=279824 RepID=A0A1G5Y2J1_9BACT|nr:NUDIX domain-containing protein [Algoriphagus alkaliphilus]MBA4302562.1 NUDIX domain-containing protein [Cyclobacterium sp.]SDA76165.1 ADP-ribose pyrophosphatase YjhB, NUDIX family [Algoriphagus alkaliphilus]